MAFIPPTTEPAYSYPMIFDAVTGIPRYIKLTYKLDSDAAYLPSVPAPSPSRIADTNADTRTKTKPASSWKDRWHTYLGCKPKSNPLPAPPRPTYYTLPGTVPQPTYYWDVYTPVPTVVSTTTTTTTTVPVISWPQAQAVTYTTTTAPVYWTYTPFVPAGTIAL